MQLVPGDLGRPRQQPLARIGEQPAKGVEVHRRIFQPRVSGLRRGARAPYTPERTRGGAVAPEEQGVRRAVLRPCERPPGSPRRTWPSGPGLSSHAVSALERGAGPGPTRTRSGAGRRARRRATMTGAALIAAVPAASPRGTRRRLRRSPGSTCPCRRPPCWGVTRTWPGCRSCCGGQPAGHPDRDGRRRQDAAGAGCGDCGAGRFADGVAYVELAPLRDPDGVLPAIADAVDAVTAADRDPLGGGRAAPTTASCSWCSTTSNTSWRWRRGSLP